VSRDEDEYFWQELIALRSIWRQAATWHLKEFTYGWQRHYVVREERRSSSSRIRDVVKTIDLRTGK